MINENNKTLEKFLEFADTYQLYLKEESLSLVLKFLSHATKNKKINMMFPEPQISITRGNFSFEWEGDGYAYLKFVEDPWVVYHAYHQDDSSDVETKGKFKFNEYPPQYFITILQKIQ